MGNLKNILFIYSDQHRFDSVGVNGNKTVKTPNLDRIASEGANFVNAYTPIPICVPARCSMLTGQWPSQHGVVFNFDGETFKPLSTELPTFPSVLRDAGYHTIHIGRWHVDKTLLPTDFGCHDYVPSWRYNKWRRAQNIPPAPNDQKFLGQTDPHVSPLQSPIGWAADQVIRHMRECIEGGEPFMIRWNTIEPHLPCRPCEPFASMYDPSQIEPWPSFDDELKGKPYIQRQMRATWNCNSWTWNDWAPLVARYYGVVSELDYHIGRVMDELKALGIDENTLLIYSADHGDMCGSHGMIDKHYVMYDDIVKVPLMLRLPGIIPHGVTVDSFVSNAIDLPTTLCDIAGVPAPKTFMGRSLLPLIRGEMATARSDIFASYHGNQFGAYSQRMVRDHKWKYVWNATDIDEIYNLADDPWELVNRVNDPVCADELARLRARLVAWMEETSDALLNEWTRRQLLQGRILS